MKTFTEGDGGLLYSVTERLEAEIASLRAEVASLRRVNHRYLCGCEESAGVFGCSLGCPCVCHELRAQLSAEKEAREKAEAACQQKHRVHPSWVCRVTELEAALASEKARADKNEAELRIAWSNYEIESKRGNDYAAVVRALREQVRTLRGLLSRWCTEFPGTTGPCGREEWSTLAESRAALSTTTGQDTEGTK